MRSIDHGSIRSGPRDPDGDLRPNAHTRRFRSTFPGALGSGLSLQGIMVHWPRAMAGCWSTRRHPIHHSVQDATQEYTHDLWVVYRGRINRELGHFFPMTCICTIRCYLLFWPSLAAGVFGNLDDRESSGGPTGDNAIRQAIGSCRLGGIAQTPGSIGMKRIDETNPFLPEWRSFGRLARDESTKQTHSCQNGSRAAESRGPPIARTNPPRPARGSKVSKRTHDDAGRSENTGGACRTG